ncbi:hypothetical protein SESBI_08431 [Sesbania bispinosa]|nr:hypothetical protein SESBI_08431 [Sesbania bispinosa]
MTKAAWSKSNASVVLPRRCCVAWTVVGVVVSLVAMWLFWPWDPEVEMAQLRVKRVKLHPLPPVSADVWLSVTVSVHNKGAYWMELADVDVGVKYRGRKMGHVESQEWHLREWGTVHVFGELEFSGLPSADVSHLLQDLAKGRVYFRTVTEVTGHLGFLFFHLSRTFKIIAFQSFSKYVAMCYAEVVLRSFKKKKGFSALYTMNLENCHCLGTRNNSNWSSYERIGYDPIVCVNEFVTRMKMASWKALWKKIKREKRRFFRSSPVVHVQYDPDSYLQNFDDGYSTDPDNVSRSFSARFAAPSKVFEKSEVMDDGELEINDDKSNML